MRRALFAVTAAAAALALAACTPDVPQPSVAASIEEGAALQDAQAQSVIDATFEELDAADAALDSSMLGDRVSGQAKAARDAQYKLKKADGSVALTDIPSQMQAVYLPAAGEWPRIMAAVTEQPGDDLTPVVLVWVQDSISDDYTLVGWAHMVPGAALPSMPGAVTGTEVLALDTSTLDPSPSAAYSNYLDLLRAGSDSDLASQFSADTYRERLFAARTELTKTAQESGGTFVDTIEPNMDATYAISTADGGALVLAPLQVRSAITVKDATIIVPGSEQPLVEGEIKDQLTHTYDDYLVMYIPGPGADGLPGVVAADHSLVKLSAS
ncbi:hypothetical protein RN607_10470 [Demequina capsici]|uniref:DUF8094 domain-containing protein n=1 Tax=Demequina capsici TaxID=3075620 RepID=A0AA96FDK7_9MICO|nr:MULTISPECIES: hypothetical protein [unclassified Demequina]WNM23782.1 hypothetical protein RN606_10470 [Demequina sp. OYTSA14]WNM26621.1 hypothetical protein RN607_10470 [Demequina sp. PMTSA13]